MKYLDASDKITEYRGQIADLRKKMRQLQSDREPEEVKDYEFATTSKPIHLSDLFGDRDDLIVIHNMGKACRACTLWADGFNGIYDHLVDRAAFVVASPDEPAVQGAFAEGRGWRFPMVSHSKTTFAADMSYRNKNGWMPGVSVFKREPTRIVRVSDTSFKPGDDFCTMWHFLDLFPGGYGDWMPKFDYGNVPDKKAIAFCCSDH
jgi:predicted dithiol-disulfide oxidoreductase (DUF899 family)